MGPGGVPVKAAIIMATTGSNQASSGFSFGPEKKTAIPYLFPRVQKAPGKKPHSNQPNGCLTKNKKTFVTLLLRIHVQCVIATIGTHIANSISIRITICI